MGNPVYGFFEITRSVLTNSHSTARSQVTRVSTRSLAVCALFLLRDRDGRELFIPWKAFTLSCAVHSMFLLLCLM